MQFGIDCHRRTRGVFPGYQRLGDKQVADASPNEFRDLESRSRIHIEKPSAPRIWRASRAGTVEILSALFEN